jgi:hypothetical protein
MLASFDVVAKVAFDAVGRLFQEFSSKRMSLRSFKPSQTTMEKIIKELKCNAPYKLEHAPYKLVNLRGTIRTVVQQGGGRGGSFITETMQSARDIDWESKTIK